ncbi:putative oxidoreductase YcsN [Propionigenium maris DSM 9537]|uniref:Oxidoreductase YcsN n=1 Tax=Propionigenium maris DSM 9537 TaxID=1123000 RepID=A0A9W6GJV6_9FUSO|nr:aldo/keto reductase [Propionigenium maris]GLI54972.1 putative oxidoreductase YcsN [Propionigenium maris DSM 9537]
MKKVKLGEDLEISKVVHGYWRLNDWKLTDSQCLDLIKRSMEIGVTTFDHADIYGNYTCEELFGRALALDPSLRDEMQIITKCGITFKSENRPENDGHYYNTSREHIISSAERSLKNFGTDYIDLLLIHRPDFLMDPEEVASAFSHLKREGKVRNFGVSNFLPHQFDMLQSYVDEDLVTNQVELSPWNVENFENGALDSALKNRIKPMAWSPLGGGEIFKSQSIKAIRLREALEEVRVEIGAEGIDQAIYAWLLTHPAGIIPVVGTGNFTRLKGAVKALDYHLNRRQWFKILDASRGREVD